MGLAPDRLDRFARRDLKGRRRRIPQRGPVSPSTSRSACRKWRRASPGRRRRASNRLRQEVVDVRCLELVIERHRHRTKDVRARTSRPGRTRCCRRGSRHGRPVRSGILQLACKAQAAVVDGCEAVDGVVPSRRTAGRRGDARGREQVDDHAEALPSLSSTLPIVFFRISEDPPRSRRSWRRAGSGRTASSPSCRRRRRSRRPGWRPSSRRATRSAWPRCRSA